MATKKKVRRFAAGGAEAQDDVSGVDAAVAAQSDTGEWARGENYGDNTTPSERVSMARAPSPEATNEELRSIAAERFEPAEMTKQTFKQAFAAARGAGDKTFEWEGKKYSTAIAGEKSSPKASTSSETSRMAKRHPAPVADETSRLAKRYPGGRAPSKVSTLASGESSGQGRILRDVRPSRVNPNTLLPYKKGGAVSASSRADGIAKRGKTRGTMR